MSTPTVSISLTAKEGAKALDFYTRAFDAETVMRMDTPGGGLAHAEFKLGQTNIYLSDEAEEYNAKALPEGQMSPCLFSVRTEDCDKAYAKALAAGAKSLIEPRDNPWGSRGAMVLDPFGYRWGLSQELKK